jgi:hypothetical protein
MYFLWLEHKSIRGEYQSEGFTKSPVIINLQNTVLYLTPVTSNTCSLLDVMIRNEDFYHSTTRVIEIGFSDHFALVMGIFVHSPSTCLKFVEERGFSKRNIEYFKDQL